MTLREFQRKLDTPEGGTIIQFGLMISALVFHTFWPVIVLMVLSAFGIMIYIRRKSAPNPRIGEVCQPNPGIGCAGELITVPSAQMEELLVQRNQLLDAVAYYQTLDDMNQQQSAEAGIKIKGWWCNTMIESMYPDTKGQLVTCDTFNGEEHSTRSTCRHCDNPKVNPNPRIENVQTHRR